MKLLTDLAGFLRRNLVRASDRWPFTRGDYVVLDAAAAVVIASVGDGPADELVTAAPAGLCMVARLHSPQDAANLLRAVGANLAVRAVLCIGADDPKEPLASALLKLGGHEDVPAGVTGSLMNTVAAKLEPADLVALRKRIRFVDLRGNDARKILARIQAASGEQRANAGFVTRPDDSGLERLVVPRDVRHAVQPDKTGHFVIRLEEQSIVVEHRSAENEPLRVIEGKTARDICLTLIRNGWVSRARPRRLSRPRARARGDRVTQRPGLQPRHAPSRYRIARADSGGALMIPVERQSDARDERSSARSAACSRRTSSRSSASSCSCASARSRARPGVLDAVLILLAAKLITTLTAFSLAADRDQHTGKAGGAYYLISRSLGVEFGGGIALVFYLAQAISVAMYVIGFAEAFVATFPDLGVSPARGRDRRECRRCSPS